jgi:hypothetical protein
VSGSLILLLFLALRFGQHLLERLLARKNRRYYRDGARLADAGRALGISAEDLRRSVAYAADRERLAAISAWAWSSHGLSRPRLILAAEWS